jgi:RNA polymerase sigma factor (TIGR02999 family)
MPLTVDEAFVVCLPALRRLAAKIMRFKHLDFAYSDDDLVNETYLKAKARTHALELYDDLHALKLFTRMVSQVARDHLRTRAAQKRGGGVMTAVDLLDFLPANELQLNILNEALDRLDQIDHDAAQVVELKFYGGLHDDEVASILGISSKTVRRRWLEARQFLRAFLVEAK